MRRYQAMGFLAAAMAVMMACSSATTVWVDYDRDADFSKYKTFAWAEPEAGFTLEETSPLLHKRIVNYIKAKMEAGGLQYDPKDPDVYVTYYTSTKEEMSLNATTMGYSYGPGWYWDPYWYGSWGYGPTTTTVNVTTYTKGTLVIDIWDAHTKQLLWRGSMEGTVPENPEAVSDMIYKGIDKIVAKWQSMKKEAAKERAKAKG